MPKNIEQLCQDFRDRELDAYLDGIDEAEAAADEIEEEME